MMSAEVRVLFNVLNAPSTVQQGQVIRKVIESRGYKVQFKSSIGLPDIYNNSYRAYLWFTLPLVEFLVSDAPSWITARTKVNKPAVIYTTIEGIPKRANVLCSPLPNLEFVANSKFTADMLTEAGLKVIDVVHHGFDPEERDKALKTAHVVASKWDAEFKGRCRIIYVGANNPRKSLDKLSQAINIFNATHKDKAVFIIYSEPTAQQLFNQENVVVIPDFAKRPHLEVLRYMAAAHYFVWPSRCEGFGLPVLEANSLGRPAIHCMYPPLSEFTSEEFNFVWDYDDRVLVDTRLSQYYIFHDYPTEVLAEALKDAVDTFFEDRERYYEYCAKAKEHAEEWSCYKVYRKLLYYLGLDGGDVDAQDAD